MSVSIGIYMFSFSSVFPDIIVDMRSVDAFSFSTLFICGAYRLTGFAYFKYGL